MIDDLLKDGDFGFLFINMEQKRFDTCFSKFEMVSGLETITRVVDEKKIPCFAVKTSAKNTETKIPGSSGETNPSDIPVTSKYDEDFKEKFSDLIKIVPEPISSSFYDAFTNRELIDQLKNKKINKVLMCGFDSEREILASVIGAVRESFTPVIMSDCVSSVSERVFFEVMNVLSRWSVVGDTRDMVKLWNLW